jgi:hypothetical protein
LLHHHRRRCGAATRPAAARPPPQVLQLDCVPESGAATRQLSGLAALGRLTELRLPSVSFGRELWALAARLPLLQLLQLDILDLAGGQALAAAPALRVLELDEVWLPDEGEEVAVAAAAGQALEEGEQEGEEQQQEEGGGQQRRGLLARAAPALARLAVDYYTDEALLGDLWGHRHLSCLSLSAPSGALPADLAPLALLPRLAALSLDDTHGGSVLGSLAPLAACGALTSLSLSCRRLLPGQLAALAGGGGAGPAALRQLGLRVDTPLDAAALRELVALLLGCAGLEAAAVELCLPAEGGAPLDEALRAEEGAGRLAGLSCEEGEGGRGLELEVARLDGSALRLGYKWFVGAW